MVKQTLIICMIFLLPGVILQLLISLLFKLEFDWQYTYMMTIFSLVAAIILARAYDVKERSKKESNLNYTAIVPSAPLLVLTIIMVLNTTITVEGLEKEAIFLRIIVLVVLIALAFLKFKFYIEENNLTYEITFFTIPLYKRRLFPYEIESVKFIRSGWAGKGAIIKVNKGFNIRILYFKPLNVCSNLNTFTDKHEIATSKSKDYVLLDNSSRQSSLKEEEGI